MTRHNWGGRAGGGVYCCKHMMWEKRQPGLDCYGCGIVITNEQLYSPEKRGAEANYHA